MRRFLASVFFFLLIAPNAIEASPRVTTLSNYPISITYDSDDERVAERVGEICSASIPRLAAEIGLAQVRGFRIVLLDDIEAFKREQGIMLPSWGVAFAFMESQAMVVDVNRAANAWNTLETVIPHELSHLLVAQRVGPDALPVWFVEGMAMWQAREWSMMDNWRLMESVWTNRLPSLAAFQVRLPRDETSARDAYRVSYFGFSERFENRTELLPEFLDEVTQLGGFSEAFESFFGESEADYYVRVHEGLYRKYKTRLLLFQVGPLFSVLSILFLFVVLRVRLRNRRKLREMEAREAGLSFDE